MLSSSEVEMSNPTRRVGSGRVEKIQRSLGLVGFENSDTTKYFLFRELIHSLDVVKFCNV